MSVFSCIAYIHVLIVRIVYVINVFVLKLIGLYCWQFWVRSFATETKNRRHTQLSRAHSLQSKYNYWSTT